MHSIFKLEIQAVQSLDYYPNAKQKRKIPHQKISMLLSYFPCMSTGSSYILLKVYIIISNNQSLFCFHYKYWKWFRMTQKMFLLICSKEKKKPHFISGTLLQPQNHCMLLLNCTSYPSLSLSSWTAFCCFFKHTYYFSLYISNTFHIWILAWLPEFHWRHSILATSHLQWPAIFLLQEGSL